MRSQFCSFPGYTPFADILRTIWKFSPTTPYFWVPYHDYQEPYSASKTEKTHGNLGWYQWDHLGELWRHAALVAKRNAVGNFQHKKREDRWSERIEDKCCIRFPQHNSSRELSRTWYANSRGKKLQMRMTKPVGAASISHAAIYGVSADSTDECC